MNFNERGRSKLTKKSTATYLCRVQWLMIIFFICNIIQIVSVTYHSILSNELHIADSIRVSLPRGFGNYALGSYCLVTNQFNQIILGPNAQCPTVNDQTPKHYIFLIRYIQQSTELTRELVVTAIILFTRLMVASTGTVTTLKYCSLK